MAPVCGVAPEQTICLFRCVCPFDRRDQTEGVWPSCITPLFHRWLLYYGLTVWFHLSSVHLRLCLRNFKIFKGSGNFYVMTHTILEVKMVVLSLSHDFHLCVCVCVYNANLLIVLVSMWHLLSLVHASVCYGNFLNPFFT